MASALSIEGARIVRTDQFARLHELAHFVISLHGILVVDGDLGVGKTVLTDHLVASQTGPTAVVQLPPRQTSRDIVRWLHAAVCIGGGSDDLSERDIQDDLVEHLQTPHTIVVRDVQRLSTEAAGQLERLHSNPKTAWTLILEGGPGTGRAVQRDALLGARISGHLTVPVLSGDALVTTVQQMHDALLSTEPALIGTIDAKVCRGVFRNWERFLQIAVHLRNEVAARGKPLPEIDATFARAVVQRMPRIARQKATR